MLLLVPVVEKTTTNSSVHYTFFPYVNLCKIVTAITHMHWSKNYTLK